MSPPLHEPRFARVAAMVADPARSRMLCLLLSGDSATAGELAEAAGVTPATASGHLGKLEQEGLVLVAPRGRHRYYRLASAEVAHALEALALVAELGERERSWHRPERQALREARCCYGHLAGRLGVCLHARLLDGEVLRSTDDGYGLTPAASRAFAAIDFEPPPTVAGRSAPRGRQAYPCMDWSERRDHLAGPLATALLQHFLARDWLRRTQGRALALTPGGQRALLPWLDGRD